MKDREEMLVALQAALYANLEAQNHDESKYVGPRLGDPYGERVQLEGYFKLRPMVRALLECLLENSDDVACAYEADMFRVAIDGLLTK